MDREIEPIALEMEAARASKDIWKLAKLSHESGTKLSDEDMSQVRALKEELVAQDNWYYIGMLADQTGLELSDEELQKLELDKQIRNETRK